jgi:hypothetical protein
MAAKIPTPGQRYRNVEAKLRDADWIVSKVFTGADGIEYAALQSSSDTTRRKTLALAIVGDPRRFHLIDTPAATD